MSSQSSLKKTTPALLVAILVLSFGTLTYFEVPMLRACKEEPLVMSGVTSINSVQLSKWNQMTTKNSLHFFHQDPVIIVETLAACLMDELCHVVYHHIPKTAGSLIASTLHPIFENGDRYKSRQWCCYERVMERFVNATDYYCLKRKLGIYEVWGDEFSQVLHTCEDKYGTGSSHAKATHKAHRYVALITTREPIQRTVSLIHQQCNSGYDKHNANFQDMCRECHYNDESQNFWNGFVGDTNRAYQTMASFILEFATNNTTGNNEGTLSAPVLLLDNSMVDDFFSLFQKVLERNASGPQLNMNVGNPNPENRSICDFGISSSMMRGLRPASTIFFDLWSGKLTRSHQRSEQYHAFP